MRRLIMAAALCFVAVGSPALAARPVPFQVIPALDAFQTRAAPVRIRAGSVASNTGDLHLNCSVSDTGRN